MPIIQINAFQCNKCGHIWISRAYLKDKKSLPIACAKCKSAYWDRGSTVVTMAEGGKFIEKENYKRSKKQK